jgi:5-methylcytosine-specific restriction endonuclease McrA
MPYLDKEKRREYQRTWIAARRVEFFTGKTCVGCGGVTDLQLDHVIATSKVSHKIWSWREELRNAELAKCQVLCAGCHKVKTKERAEHRRKFSDEEIRCVLRMRSQGATTSAISKSVGICARYVRFLVSGRGRVG